MQQKMYFYLDELKKKDLKWIIDLRNQNIVYLRQSKFLSLKDQKKWFKKSNDLYWMIKYTMKNEYSLEEIEKGKSDYDLNFPVEKNHGIIGITHLDFINKHAELSYLLQSFNIKCDDMVKQIINFGFLNLGLNKLYNETYDFDDFKNALWIRLGFKRSAVLEDHVFHDGKFHDSFIYSMKKEEWSNKIEN